MKKNKGYIIILFFILVLIIISCIRISGEIKQNKINVTIKNEVKQYDSTLKEKINELSEDKNLFDNVYDYIYKYNFEKLTKKEKEVMIYLKDELYYYKEKFRHADEGKLDKSKYSLDRFYEISEKLNQLVE